MPFGVFLSLPVESLFKGLTPTSGPAGPQEQRICKDGVGTVVVAAPAVVVVVVVVVAAAAAGGVVVVVAVVVGRSKNSPPT